MKTIILFLTILFSSLVISAQESKPDWLVFATGQDGTIYAIDLNNLDVKENNIINFSARIISPDKDVISRFQANCPAKTLTMLGYETEDVIATIKKPEPVKPKSGTPAFLTR
jgi:hypothetical protein